MTTQSMRADNKRVVPYELKEWPASFRHYTKKTILEAILGQADPKERVVAHLKAKQQGERYEDSATIEELGKGIEEAEAEGTDEDARAFLEEFFLTQKGQEQLLCIEQFQAGEELPPDMRMDFWRKSFPLWSDDEILYRKSLVDALWKR